MTNATRLKREDIEPGIVVLGPSGQVREVLAMNETHVRVRMLNHGSANHPTLLPVGSDEWIGIRALLVWAVEDITEQRAS